MKITKNLLNEYNLDKIGKIYEDLKNHENNNSSDSTKKLNKDIVEKIITEITEKFTITENEITWILITGLLQRGGSNLKAGSTTKFTVGKYSLSSKQLNDTIKKHIKNGTNRQMARIIAEEIAEIALKLNIFGDLHNQMLLEHPNMTDQEKV